MGPLLISNWRAVAVGSIYVIVKCVVVEVPNGGFLVRIPRVPFGSDLLFILLICLIRVGVELALLRLVFLKYTVGCARTQSLIFSTTFEITFHREICQQ